MPQQLPQPTALRWRDHWPPLLVLLACLLAMGGIAKLAFERDRAELQAQVQTELRALRLRLGVMAESSFDVTASLETLIQVQGDLDAKAFDAAATHLLRDQPQLRNVVAAPGDVVRHVHPLKGNEAVLGLDYRAVPAQWAQVERSRALRAPIVFAPVRLVQGGKAVVQRRPVFLSAPGQPDRYWGTLAAVANLDPFIARAGLGETKLRLALYERLQDGRPGERIWGDAELLAQRHAREELRLTGATWTLIGAPAQGWGWVWRGSDPWLWIGSLVSGLIVAMSVVLTRRRLLLAQRSVALEAEVLGHQQSQRELQAATARLRALLQISSDWYWEQDAEFRTVEISGFEGMARTEGMQLSLGRCRWEHPWVDPEVPGEAAWAAHRQACERHEPFRDFEYAARLPDGRRNWVRTSGDPCFDAEGRFSGYRGTSRDITELHEAKERLSAAQAQLDSLMAAPVQTAVIALDLQGRVKLFNRGAELMLGYRAEDLMGKVPLMLHRPDELQARCAELSQQLGRAIAPLDLFAHLAQREMATPHVWTYRHRDGRELTVSQSPSTLRDAEGRVIGYLGMMVDITAQRAAERQLRATSERLRAVLDGAQEVGILVCDNAGRITLFNRGAEHLFGYATHEAIGRPTLMLQDRAELEQRRSVLQQQTGQTFRLPQVMTETVQRGAPALSHWTFVRKGGERFAGALRLSRLEDPEGGPPSYLAIVLDVSEQLRAQQQLEQLNSELEQRVQARGRQLAQVQEELLRSERMAALGSLVAGVAHELNTPLGTCLTATSTLQERTLELQNSLQQQQLRRSTLEAYAKDASMVCDLLLRGLGNATELVAHFKQLSVDQTSDQRRPFQLATVVSDVLTVMRPQLKQGRMRIETAIEVPTTIDAYPGELGRLLTNLIQNAQLHAFAAEQQGLLRIEGRELDGEHFELRVRDDGRGMGAEERRRAFDPFFTTKLGQGGSGLGLNIVFNIAVGVLGGEVSLNTEPGQGAEFVFRLPFKAPQRAKPGDQTGIKGTSDAR